MYQSSANLHLKDPVEDARIAGDMELVSADEIVYDGRELDTGAYNDN